MVQRRDSQAGSRPVYSSEVGRICAGCGQPTDACACREQTTLPSTAGPVRVGRETKGRKGKSATVVSDIPLAAPELKELCK